MSPGGIVRPRAGRRLGAEALVWIVVLRLALLFLPFRKVLGLTRPHKAVGPSLEPAEARFVLERVAAGVTRASQLIPGTRCLPRALAGQALLRRRGIVAELRIGVAPRSEDKDLRAHAWLEAGGIPLLTGGPLDPYTPLSGPETGF